MERNDWRVAPDDTVQVMDSRSKKLQSLYKRPPPLNHSWSACLSAVCVIFIVLLGVAVASILLHPEDQSSLWLRISYNLADVFDQSLFVKNGSSADKWKSTCWIQGSQLAYWDHSGGISVYLAESNSTRILDGIVGKVSGKTFVSTYLSIDWHAHEFWPSFDGRYVLLRQKLDSIADQKQSFYAVYDTEEKHLNKLRMNVDDYETSLFDHVTWMANSPVILVAIYRHDVYWINHVIRQDWNRVSYNGRSPFIYNGLPDWTYSEGIVSHRALLWPSWNGDWLLYGTLNCSQCQQLNYIDYRGEVPVANIFHYSTPSSPLTSLELKLLNMANGSEVNLPSIGTINNRPLLLLEIRWLNVNSFISAWTIRNQNMIRLIYCFLASGWQCQQIFADEARGAQRLQQPKLFSSPGYDEFLYVSQCNDESVNEAAKLIYFQRPWRKRYVVHLKSFHVDRIVGWDRKNHLMYFLGNSVAEPNRRRLYSVADGYNNGHEINCVSCQLAIDACDFVDAYFDVGARYCELKCLGPAVPSVHLIEIASNRIGHTLRRVGDQELAVLVHLTPKTRYLDVPLPDGSNGRVQMLLPRAWREKLYHRFRFPLIIQILDWNDGSLSEQWKQDWSTYIVNSRQFVYARISGRERSNQFGALRFAAEDAIAIAKYITSKYDQVDSRHVIVIGEGVGGYISTGALAKDKENVFRCAVAISPIVDWPKHETSIAEMFLGDMKSNYENYQSVRMDGIVGNMKSDSFFLMDSYVFNPVGQFHVMKLSKLLVKAGVRFRQKINPHAVARVTKFDFYTTLEHFIDECSSDS